MKTILLKNRAKKIHFITKLKYRRNHIKNFIYQMSGEKSRTFIGENDYHYILKELSAKKTKKFAKKTFFVKLRYILKKSHILPFRLIPPNIITMNSRFIIVTGKGKVLELHLVCPDKADKNKGLISIFSWVGLCLIGRKEGDTIKNFYIDKIIYQPGVNEGFHL